MSLQKRPRVRTPSPDQTGQLHYLRPPSPSSSAASDLTIQAHEAALIPSSHDTSLAILLESTPEQVEGGRLIPWRGDAGVRAKEGDEVWVDRYDVLNLFTALPTALRTKTIPPAFSTTNSESDSEDERGFSNLPSDSEEMFYFSPGERDDIRRRKRRREMERGREERIAALRSRSPSPGPGSETEPSADQLALMRRLHSTLLSAADPSLLELRILANHGADERFAFLRRGGKWRAQWEEMRKGGGEDQKAAEEAKGTQGLVAYGSDTSDEEDAAQADRKEAEPPSAATGTTPAQLEEEKAETQARARREAKAVKVREWAQRRKEAREAAEAEATGAERAGQGA